MMLCNGLFFAFSIFLMLACRQNKTADIATVAENYYQERLLFYPLEATQAGDNRYNDLYPNNISKQFKKELSAFYNNYKKLLQGINKSSLSTEDQLTHDVLSWECTINLEELGFPSELMPIDQFWSDNLYFGQLASGASAQPFKTVRDYQNWLSRVDGFITWCDTALANMKQGMKKGYVLPKSLIRKVIPQMASLMQGPVAEHLYYKPVLLLPDSFSTEQKEAVKNDYIKMVGEKIIPLYKHLYTFFNEEYLPSGRESSGYDALPDGSEWYKQRIKNYTTLEMSPDEIHQLGLSEVARISTEMEKIRKKVGYNGDLKSFFDFVRNNKALMPFDKPEQVIANFEAIHNRMKPHLVKLFNLVPKTSFEVRRTEAFREKSASAEYNPGSLDGTRPGIFYKPIPDIKIYNVFQDESLFLHEAIPGHHYQISLQQENESLPKFRKILWYSAFGEGWALYTESMGKELGLYDDPYQYFGMLSAEMHRAIRLVVDSGIHSKGWSREQAIQYSIDHEAEPLHKIEREIERYMAGPGQALSYKIGQLKIRELRNRAEQALGNAFDIRLFHDKILESGCIPLKILEAKINHWIEHQAR